MRRITPYRAGIGASSTETRETATKRLGRDVERVINGKLEHADKGERSGKPVKGNLAEDQTSVTFKKADFDTFVSHDLGYTCENWTVVGQSKAGRIYNGRARAGRFGLWLRCDTAGVVATIRIDGQRRES